MGLRLTLKLQKYSFKIALEMKMIIISFAELQCSAVCMWVAEVNGICSHRPIRSHWMFNFLITKSMILSDYFTWKKVKQKLTSLFKLFLNYSQSDFLITFFSRSDSQLKISSERKHIVELRGCDAVCQNRRV